MRMIAIVAIMFATVLTDGADAAPWCAQYGTGGTNCGFHSFEQCLAARSGNGGFCSQNSFEDPYRTGGGSGRGYGPYQEKQSAVGVSLLRGSCPCTPGGRI